MEALNDFKEGEKRYVKNNWYVFFLTNLIGLWIDSYEAIVKSLITKQNVENSKFYLKTPLVTTKR